MSDHDPQQDYAAEIFILDGVPLAAEADGLAGHPAPAA
jgi:hypothetical protein